MRVEYSKPVPLAFSLVTNASVIPASAGCQALTTGKLGELVTPVTWALKALSSAIQQLHVFKSAPPGPARLANRSPPRAPHLVAEPLPRRGARQAAVPIAADRSPPGRRRTRRAAALRSPRQVDRADQDPAPRRPGWATQ